MILPSEVTSVADLKTLLDSLPANTADAPYPIVLKVNSLSGDYNATSPVSLGNVLYTNRETEETPAKYISLDLSGSSFASNKVEFLAFYDCNNLTGIILPDDLESIGNAAFNGCTSLADINIPDGVTAIGSSAFLRCASLTEITIPVGVTSIEKEAFNACTNLASVSLTDNLESIGDSAFSSCRSLISVTIPDSVKTIGSNAFQNCHSLTSVTFEGQIPSANFDDSGFANIGDLRGKFYETDEDDGTPGTYLRTGTAANYVWTLEE